MALPKTIFMSTAVALSILMNSCIVGEFRVVNCAMACWAYEIHGVNPNNLDIWLKRQNDDWVARQAKKYFDSLTNERFEYMRSQICAMTAKGSYGDSSTDVGLFCNCIDFW